MPTRDVLESFWSDWDGLTLQQQAAFLRAVRKFVSDLSGGHGFRVGLRVKGVRGAGGIDELTWAPDGRATFEYGSSLREADVHIVWRRIGTHEILRRP